MVVAVALCALTELRGQRPGTDEGSIKIPRGIPEALWKARVDTDSLTPKKIDLGHDLFHDPILSVDGTVSCATCHDPAIGYATHRPVAVGVGGRIGVRNAPTVFNTAFSDVLFWDGRARTLEAQALMPLRSPDEMGAQDETEIVRRVQESPRYRKRFSVVYGADGITIRTLVDAIVAFERSLLSGDAAFDRFMAGDRASLTDSAQRGWRLFRGAAGCIRCHRFDAEHPFFTDFGFHNTGIAARNPAAGDPGRFRISGRDGEIGAFKTPTLRDVALTAPYMHDGSVPTLAAVVSYYSEGPRRNPSLDAGLRPLHFDAGRQRDLVMFLESLTGADALARARAAPRSR
jgi:cytochrome c peroxidase